MLSGLIAKKFGFDIIPVTKVGNDFSIDNKNLLHKNGIEINQSHIAKNFPTTRFLITIKEDKEIWFCVLNVNRYGMRTSMESTLIAGIISPVFDDSLSNCLQILPRISKKMMILYY